MIWPTIILASSLVLIQQIDVACESAKEAIDIMKYDTSYLDSKEIFGSRATLLHALFADETSQNFRDDHALLVAWKDGTGSVLFCKDGDWNGQFIDAWQWRHVMAVSNGRQRKEK